MDFMRVWGAADGEMLAMIVEEDTSQAGGEAVLSWEYYRNRVGLRAQKN
jgi:hypothetical protein